MPPCRLPPVGGPWPPTCDTRWVTLEGVGAAKPRRCGGVPALGRRKWEFCGPRRVLSDRTPFLLKAAPPPRGRPQGWAAARVQSSPAGVLHLGNNTKGTRKF
eukprot:295073-Chlamydomonas_euryale.AAC.7